MAGSNAGPSPRISPDRAVHVAELRAELLPGLAAAVERNWAAHVRDVRLFGGPLAGSAQGRVRVLLVVDSDSKAEIHRRLGDLDREELLS